MKPEIGTWELKSPSGMQFKAGSPIKCLRDERDSRLFDDEQIANMNKFLSQCELCEDDKATYALGKGTPAEIHVCTTCKNTLLNETFSEPL